MGYQRLAIYFKTNFSLMQHHKWSISEIEEMMPWERQVYIDLLQDWIKQKEQELKEQEMQMKAQANFANRKRM
jgi:hypothetical protein